MSRLELFLFGPPRLIYKGRPVRLKLRKTLALLAYLAVTRQPHSRDALVTLLWPKESPSVGRANLRRHLYRLNRTLDEDLISSGGEQTISLKPQAGLWLDIEMYRQQVAHLPNPGPAGEIDPVTLSHLIEATKLYTDDFMAGFTLPDSPACDDWPYYQREELRRSLGQVLIQLS
ncbi:MAG: hypothetical protein H3C34_11975, partial [Caldilineaceae bacterium]|nr:hypothetical protein [Caldilineaceae bacterium]